jgi:hypothetical protein
MGLITLKTVQGILKPLTLEIVEYWSTGVMEYWSKDIHFLAITPAL